MAVSSPAVDFVCEFSGYAGHARAESLADFVTASEPQGSGLDGRSASTMSS